MYHQLKLMIFSGLRNKKIFRFVNLKAKRKEKTHYQQLELPTNASQHDIRKHYLRLTKIYHPDIYKGSDKGRFQKIQAAYQVLSDNQLRRKYDKSMGSDRPNQQQVMEEQVEKQKKQQYGDKKPNDFSYNTKSQQADYNIDEEYQKFFGKPSKTEFEEIRLHEQQEFKAKSEKERIRSRFKQLYSDNREMYEQKYQKSYEEILNEQLNQRNKHFEQKVKYAAQANQYYSDKNIRKQKKRIYFLFVATTICGFPLLLSAWTKYLAEVQERNKLLDIMGKIEQQMQLEEVQSRFVY